MRRAVLQSHWREDVLRHWLNWLLHPVCSTTLYSSDTNARLRKVRREIRRLKRIGGGFLDNDGSPYIYKAVANLEAEEKHLLSERRNHTYGCKVFRRTAPKELGNVESAERFGVSRFIVRRLKPTENPFDVLEKELRGRKVFLSSKAVQMKVRRLQKKIETGQHTSWDQILQYQYRCFKYFSCMSLWPKRSRGFARIPAGYLTKCLTLTGREVKLLRSLANEAKS